MIFIRFLLCLGVGLVGLSMVMLSVIETLFLDWDPAEDLRTAIREPRTLRRLLWQQPPPPAEPMLETATVRLNAYGRPERGRALALE